MNYNKQYLHPKSDELDEDTQDGNILGYYSKFKQNTFLQIPIDEDIKGPKYYRGVTQAINDLKEGDVVQFDIASPGGQLDGLVSLLASIENTEAHIIGNIIGSASSAASILALSCDEIYVSPYATMLVHNASYGVNGKAADVKGYVDHLNDVSEKMLKEVYKYFLSEDEIQKVIQGTDLWFNAEQISERLQNKQDKEMQEIEVLQKMIEDEKKAQEAETVPVQVDLKVKKKQSKK